MANTTRTVYIDAPPSRVYRALISSQQLSRWWCHCSGDTREGGELTFIPSADAHIKVFIEKTVANTSVIWRCQHIYADADGKHCSATIEFNLWPKRSGTQLVFNRFDVSGIDKEADETWRHNLHRLKSLIEKGFADYTATSQKPRLSVRANGH